MTTENQFLIDQAFRQTENKAPIEQKREYTFTLKNEAIFNAMVGYIKNNQVQATGRKEEVGGRTIWTLTLADQDAFDRMNGLFYNYLMFQNN